MDWAFALFAMMASHSDGSYPSDAGSALTGGNTWPFRTALISACSYSWRSIITPGMMLIPGLLAPSYPLARNLTQGDKDGILILFELAKLGIGHKVGMGQ